MVRQAHHIGWAETYNPERGRRVEDRISVLLVLKLFRSSDSTGGPKRLESLLPLDPDSLDRLGITSAGIIMVSLVEPLAKHRAYCVLSSKFFLIEVRIPRLRHFGYIHELS